MSAHPEQSVQSAERAVERRQSAELQSFLLLRSGAERFALPAILVRRVLDAEPLVPVPRAQDYVCGVANIGGRVVCIIRLDELLGYGSATDTRAPRPFWVIVDLPDGQLGLAVDSIRQSPPGEPVGRLAEAPIGARSLPCTDYWADVASEVFRVLSLRALYDYLMAAV